MDQLVLKEAIHTEKKEKTSCQTTCLLGMFMYSKWLSARVE